MLIKYVRQPHEKKQQYQKENARILVSRSYARRKRSADWTGLWGREDRGERGLRIIIWKPFTNIICLIWYHKRNYCWKYLINCLNVHFMLRNKLVMMKSLKNFHFKCGWYFRLLQNFSIAVTSNVIRLTIQIFHVMTFDLKG